MTTNEQIGARIRQRREELGLTLEELGDQLSLNKSTIMRYESGEVQKIKLPILQSLAQALDVDPNWLALKTDVAEPYYKRTIPTATNIIPLPLASFIPLVGNIACGEPILAEENIEGYVKAPAYCEGSFALRCKGDSMTGARIMDGDIVIIRQQSDIDDGEIAAVLIEDEATLKRVYKMPGRLVLRAENPRYAPIDLSGAELDGVRILGKAVYFISSIK